MNGRRLSVVLASVLLMGVLMALGITQVTAQDNPNSQLSTSKLAADARGEHHQATTLKKVLWAVVKSDGTLARGKGAVSATHFGVGNGIYGVRFDQLQVLRLLVRLPWLHLQTCPTASLSRPTTAQATPKIVGSTWR
jgi:hypothetical protein